MPKVYAVGGVAKMLNVSPRRITALFYDKVLPGHRAPIVGGRRLIPASLVPTIAGALEDRGVAVEHAALALRIDGHARGFPGFASEDDPGLHDNVVLVVCPARDFHDVASYGSIDPRLDRRLILRNMNRGGARRERERKRGNRS